MLFRRSKSREPKFSEPTSHVKRLETEDEVERSLNSPDRKLVEEARERWLRERGRSDSDSPRHRSL